MSQSINLDPWGFPTELTQDSIDPWGFPTELTQDHELTQDSSDPWGFPTETELTQDSSDDSSDPWGFPTELTQDSSDPWGFPTELTQDSSVVSLVAGRTFYRSHTPEDSELKCLCGLPAKLRLSQTPKNPFRLFYTCPMGISAQCGFFRWSDEPAPTGNRETDEQNLIRHECIRLQESLNEIQQELDYERTGWRREKSELTSQLSSVQSELDALKERIKMANESVLMPPLDKLSIADDDEADDALVRHTVC